MTTSALMPRNLQPAVSEFCQHASVYGRRDVVSPTLALRATHHDSSSEEDSDAFGDEAVTEQMSRLRIGHHGHRSHSSNA